MGWHDVREGFFNEKLLWVAVLRRAVFDYVLYKGVRRKKLEWQHATRFLFSTHQNESGLSFEEVCCLFTWDPSYVRRLALMLTRSDVRKMESGRFKDEFFLTAMDMIVKNSVKWKTGEGSAPFFTPMNVSTQVKEAFTLHQVEIERRVINSPSVRWMVAR